MNNYMKTIISGLKQWVSAQKSDWNQNDSSAANFVKNRPFYSEIKEKKLVNETADIFGNEGELNYAEFNSQLFPVVGQEYKVVVNGAEHTCMAKVYQSWGAVCLGNTTLFEDVSAAGENFVIDTYENGEAYLNVVGSGAYKVEIYGMVEEVHKIDKKYVPTPELPNLEKVAYTGSFYDLVEAPYVPSDIVQYNETQYLSDSQKQKARNNIGAASVTNLENGTGLYSLKNKNSAIASAEGALALGEKTTASGKYSHAVGYGTVASGQSSHAEGSSNTASGECSHAEGSNTDATGQDSHAEGWRTLAHGSYSHAEGRDGAAFGGCSHVEGQGTRYPLSISGSANATEYTTTTTNTSSYLGGKFLYNDQIYTIVNTSGSKVTLNKTLSSSSDINTLIFVYFHYATEYGSHAEGTNTMASSSDQHVQGKYNIEDSANKYAHIVGNGSSNTSRSNAHTLDWNGVGWFKGGLKVGGTSQDDPNAVEVALKSDLTSVNITVDSALSSTSTNPVQNKVVNAAISNLNTLVGDKTVSDQINEALAKFDGNLPAVTTADNGKFLCVVNGVWTATNIARAEDVGF